MAKVMNVVFGIGIAVIIFLVVILGIKAFYVTPTSNCTYPNQQPCLPGTDVNTCNAQQSAAQTDYQNCINKYQEARNNYDRNIFFIANVLGLVALLISFSIFLFGNMINISAGVAFSGLALIVYGFARGWSGTNDALKFIVGLILAIFIIIFAVVVNKKYNSNKIAE